MQISVSIQRFHIQSMVVAKPHLIAFQAVISTLDIRLIPILEGFFAFTSKRFHCVAQIALNVPHKRPVACNRQQFGTFFFDHLKCPFVAFALRKLPLIQIEAEICIPDNIRYDAVSFVMSAPKIDQTAQSVFFQCTFLTVQYVWRYPQSGILFTNGSGKFYCCCCFGSVGTVAFPFLENTVPDPDLFALIGAVILNTDASLCLALVFGCRFFQFLRHFQLVFPIVTELLRLGKLCDRYHVFHAAVFGFFCDRINLFVHRPFSQKLFRTALEPCSFLY